MKQQPVIVIQLVHIQGPFKGTIQEFSAGSISIGRNPSSLLRFPADLTVVSRNHAEIIREGNRFKLIDLSTNGTFVNGKRMKEAYLKSGDVLSFSEGGPKVSFLTQILENQPVSENQPVLDNQPALENQPLRESQPGQENVFPATQPSCAPPSSFPPSPYGEDKLKPSSPRDLDLSGHTPVSFSQEPGICGQEPGLSCQEPGLSSQEPDLSGQKSGPIQPEPGEIDEIAVHSMRVPLIIQYGPTLRSFKEVPVTIGKEGDFQLDYPGIHSHHVQVFYNQDHYWVKDLTGQKSVAVNRKTINLKSPLNPGDELALSPRGPVFRFLGDGRLAEIQEPIDERSISADQKEKPEEKESLDVPEKKNIKGSLSILRKLWKH
ncbi:MAG: FHA domain-containing protein [bacterium]